MRRTSLRITIFEGPDGGGKTTAALEYASKVGGRYVHLGAFPGVRQGLPRLYLEAMLPALLGYEPVVLDRCWLSEKPYGDAFRDSRLRLQLVDQRMLERVAFRGAPVVVRCLPPWEAVLSSFRRRKGEEMLQREEQLRQVYDTYKTQWLTALPTIDYNYEQMELENLINGIELVRRDAVAHPVHLKSAGSWQAKALLVGEAFAERKDQDLLQQYPFVSFSGSGCSRWLTRELVASVSEANLLWINADGGLAELLNLWTSDPRLVIALGGDAAEALIKLQCDHLLIHHPQHWKRFRPREPYPLVNHLKGLL